MEQKKIIRPTTLHGIVLSENSNKENQLKIIKIAGRFILKSKMHNGSFYQTYKGVDLHQKKYVIVYIKPITQQKKFSQNYKNQLFEKISPPLKWFGTEKINKNLFDIQIYSKFGPSFFQVMKKYKKKINYQTFYLLTYHLLKLIDKIDTAGLAIRCLSLDNIIFSQSYHKHDLYLLNVFQLEKQKQQSFSTHNIKYCSIGTHLKLKMRAKDTVQSACYILMDFYEKGQLFSTVKNGTEKQYLQCKKTLKPQGFPLIFQQFFQYIKNLNHSQQVKFTQWKLKFKKYVSEQQQKLPYQWIQSQKTGTISSQSKKTTQFLPLPSDLNSQYTLHLEKIHQSIEQFDDDLNQFEEGDISHFNKVQDKIRNTSYSNKKRLLQ